MSRNDLQGLLPAENGRQFEYDNFLLSSNP